MEAELVKVNIRWNGSRKKCKAHTKIKQNKNQIYISAPNPNQLFGSEGSIFKGYGDCRGRSIVSCKEQEWRLVNLSTLSQQRRERLTGQSQVPTCSM